MHGTPIGRDHRRALATLRQRQAPVRVNQTLARRLQPLPLPTAFCRAVGLAALCKRTEMERRGVPMRDTAPSQAGTLMKHPATQALFAYWDQLRGDRLAPERAEIDPTAIRHLLADTFMLEVDAAARYPFRLAGTRVCALFGRELKDESFAALWRTPRGENGHEGEELVRTVCDEAHGAVAGVLGASAGEHHVDIEMLLLPLRHGGKTHARVLGCLSPATLPVWFGVQPVDTLVLRSFRVIRGRAAPAWPAGQTAPMPAPSVIAQRRGHLRVLEGGRQA